MRGARLRAVRPEDAPAVLDAFRGAGMDRQGEVHTLEDAQRWVETMTRAGGPRFARAIDVGGMLVGAVGLSSIDATNRTGWFWYWLHEDHRGRGLMSAAAATLAGWALADGGLERLELGHRANNPASGAVARAAGFVHEGVEREKFLIHGQRVDVLTYGRLSSDPEPATARLDWERGLPEPLVQR